MARCSTRLVIGSGNMNAIAKVAMLRKAPRIITTSTCRFIHRGLHDLTTRYTSEFFVDEHREEVVDNPACESNHRTHEAAVNCGLRFAKSIGIVALRLEDAEYI